MLSELAETKIVKNLENIKDLDEQAFELLLSKADSSLNKLGFNLLFYNRLLLDDLLALKNLKINFFWLDRTELNLDKSILSFSG